MVPLDDEGPRKNQNRPLSVASSVVQSGLAHLDTMRQPRRPISAVVQQEVRLNDSWTVLLRN